MKTYLYKRENENDSASDNIQGCRNKETGVYGPSGGRRCNDRPQRKSFVCYCLGCKCGKRHLAADASYNVRRMTS
jgi:hypothetical protein